MKRLAMKLGIAALTGTAIVFGLVVPLVAGGGCSYGMTKRERQHAFEENAAARQAALAATQPASATCPAATAKPPEPIAMTYKGPPAAVSVMTLKTYPAQYVANVRVTAPTGGWKLTLDKTEIANGTANLYLTLERPGKGELVTQSLVELTAGHTTKDVIEHANAHIFVAERGVSYFTASYQLAASSTP